MYELWDWYAEVSAALAAAVRLLHLNLGGAMRVMYLLQLHGGWMRTETQSCKCRCEALMCRCAAAARRVYACGITVMQVQMRGIMCRCVVRDTRAVAVTESLRHNKRSATGNTMQLQ